MRLAIATPLYPPENGGPATYVKLLEEHFPGRGIEADIIKFSEVRRFPKLVRHLLYFGMVLGAAKKADAVLALDPVSVGLPALLAAKLLRKRFFVKIVGDYAWEQGRQRFGVRSLLDQFVREKHHHAPMVEILKLLQKWVAECADGILVPSQYLKGIVTHWGIEPGRVTVIHNGVPTGEPASAPSLDLSRPYIVTAARLVPWKGIGGLIDALVEVRIMHPEASLIVVGDGPHRSHLETYAKARLGSGYLFTGALSHEDTLAHISAANVFALNTGYEGLSHAIIEAMMLGTPILTTNVGGNPELIENGMEGILVEYDDRKQLAEALSAMLHDATSCQVLGQRAKTKAQSFTESAMIEKTAAYFKERL